MFFRGRPSGANYTGFWGGLTIVEGTGRKKCKYGPDYKVTY